MSTRSDGLEALQAYFRPVSDDLRRDPVLGPVLRTLAETDPDVLEAVADVDRSQIRDSLELSPEERIARSWSVTASLLEYRRVD